MYTVSPLRSWTAVLLAAAFVASACQSPGALTRDEERKLDPALRALVRGEAGGLFEYDVHEGPGGARVYGVVIRTTDPEALRRAGLPLQSVHGEVATARLTVDALRRAARLPAVVSIENPRLHRPDAPGHHP